MRKLIFLILFLCSCGPAWHLQQAEKKGAKVKSDTVFQDVITELTVTDTVLRFQTVNKILAGDTITLETVRWKSKTVIDTLTKTIYQQVECKPDTVRVPVAVNTEISAGYTKWQLIGSVFGALLFCGAVAFGVYKLAGVVKKGDSGNS